MGMVMAVLVLLALTVWGVSKADRAVEARRESRSAMAAPETAATEKKNTDREAEDLANVAVIAVAIALAQDQTAASKAELGTESADMTGSENDWVSQGRARQRIRGRNIGSWALRR